MDCRTIIAGLSLFVFLLMAWKFFDILNYRDIEDDESE